MAKRAASPTTDQAATKRRKAPASKSRPDAGSVQGPDPQLLRRVIVENVTPQVDCGRFPIKRVVGESVIVTADVHADGHDAVAAALLYRRAGEADWRETPMEALGNDAWRAAFTVEDLGHYDYTVEGWIDRFGTWRHELSKKVGAGQEVTSELLEGAQLLAGTSPQTEPIVRAREVLQDTSLEQGARVEAALSEELAGAMSAHPDRSRATRYDRVLPVMVERERARFGAWYEMFPRSAGKDPNRSATFAEAAERLPYVASMGFDILYLPPIHPIGRAFRKGPNNTLTPGPDDPGSPWAIGGEEGGHDAVEPGLGTIEDFDAFVEAATRQGLEIALDLAYQASPDHPYVKEHPEWFRQRPDGTIKYAENPPKKYQDIYPINFESPEWQALWLELKRVIEFWIGHGVKIFRVDNPHTKPFRFWEWVLAAIKQQHPDTIFLSEAFTR
ncbi:MAG: DUF3416 domain-containing protein, partial [Acidobacteria bacterium]|nr:DUF3416 domain-containing protein [Acidobacteriota bacterium]